MKKILIITILLSSFTSFAKDNRPGVDIPNESFISDSTYAGNTKTKNFAKAKSILKKNNFFGIKEELYCGCEFSKMKIAKDAKCGLVARKNEKRAFLNKNINFLQAEFQS
jgi:hypothetical protein